jgi:hypothetical protein
MTEPTSLFINDHEAAALIGETHEVFRRTWRALVKKKGFPPPEKALGRDGREKRTRRWNRLAIERWAARRMPPELREISEADPLAGERARLAARLDGLDKKAS